MSLHIRCIFEIMAWFKICTRGICCYFKYVWPFFEYVMWLYSGLSAVHGRHQWIYQRHLFISYVSAYSKHGITWTIYAYWIPYLSFFNEFARITYVLTVCKICHGRLPASWRICQAFLLSDIGFKYDVRANASINAKYGHEYVWVAYKGDSGSVYCTQGGGRGGSPQSLLKFLEVKLYIMFIWWIKPQRHLNSS